MCGHVFGFTSGYSSSLEAFLTSLRAFTLGSTDCKASVKTVNVTSVCKMAKMYHRAEWATGVMAMYAKKEKTA